MAWCSTASPGNGSPTPVGLCSLGPSPRVAGSEQKSQKPAREAATRRRGSHYYRRAEGQQCGGAQLSLCRSSGRANGRRTTTQEGKPVRRAWYKRAMLLSFQRIAHFTMFNLMCCTDYYLDIIFALFIVWLSNLLQFSPFRHLINYLTLLTAAHPNMS
jgi:hypothetical protein